MKIVSGNLIEVSIEDVVNGEIKIPKNVYSIEAGAFSNISQLKKITISGSVKIIKDKAFENCSVEEVVIEDGVQSIGADAFKNCENLKSVIMADSVKSLGTNCFYNCKNISHIKLSSNLSLLPNNCFYQCFNLNNIDIPKSVKSLGFLAFYSCKNLEGINLESVEMIDNQAFTFCEKLKDVKLSDNLQHIGLGAFRSCTSLKEINIPDSVITIQKECFQKCVNLKKVKLPKSLYYISESLFSDCYKLEEINYPSSIKSIGGKAFSCCFELEKHIIPEGVVSIGDEAFENNQALNEVYLPKSLLNLGQGAFHGCSELKKVAIPPRISILSRNCFQKCEQLNEVTLSEGLTQIEDGAFCECSSLKNIIIPKSIKKIKEDAFKFSGLTEIDLADDIVLENSVFKGCASLKKANLPKDLKIIPKGLFEGCLALQEVEIPKSVEIIDDNAFNLCENFENIVLNEGLTTIGNQAFRRTGLNELRLPSTLKKLESEAFAHCSKLEKVNLPQTIQELPSNIFAETENLKEINFPRGLKRIGASAFIGCKSLEELILPDGLEIISEGAFKNCQKLKELILPKSLKLVGNEAFRGATNLEVANLGKASIGAAAFAGCPKLEYVLLSPQTKCNLTSQVTNFEYVTKLGNSFCFSKDKIGEDSFLIGGSPDLSFGLLISCFDKKEKLLKEIKDAKILALYSVLFKNLSEEKFQEFMQTKNLKFFKQLILPDYSSNNFIAFCDLFYNLGGFLPPITENYKQKNGKENQRTVDYAQKVGEFFKDHLSLDDSDEDLFAFSMMRRRFGGMQWTGFKPGYTEFLLDKNNQVGFKNEVHDYPSFLSDCYNKFEKAQKQNTSNRGSQRQLKPTTSMFRKFLFREKFSGVTEETELLAETIGEFFNDQASFDRALKIEETRKNNNIPDHILGEPLIEKDIFKSIEEITKKIESSAIDTLNVLSELASKQFTYQWLSKSDPTNFILGKLCSCCAHLEGVGYGIMKASIVHPDVQNLVIRNEKGEIIAKSTLYLNREQGYGVFNNVEVSETVPIEKREQIYLTYKRAVKAFAERYNVLFPDKPLKVLTVGMTRNDIAISITEKEKRPAKLYKALDYSKYSDVSGYDHEGDSNKDQKIIWEKE